MPLMYPKKRRDTKKNAISIRNFTNFLRRGYKKHLLSRDVHGKAELISTTRNLNLMKQVRGAAELSILKKRLWPRPHSTQPCLYTLVIPST
jgi:hypothetical protein